jgi:DDE superfamily endonuclease
MQDRLPKCVGYLDGSHVILFEAPLENHESYYSRKQQYGIQIQAICDNDKLIRNVAVGFPASVHDSRVFLNSPIGQQPENYLSDGQWLAADSAYRLTENVLTPFRDNSTFGTKPQRSKFNIHFSGNLSVYIYKQIEIIFMPYSLSILML